MVDWMNCPFCEAIIYWRQGQTTEFTCNTIITETGIEPSIGRKCLEIQLDTVKARLVEAERLLKMVINQSASHYMSGRSDIKVFLAAQYHLSKRELAVEEVDRLKALVREMVEQSILTGKLPNEPRHYECLWCKNWGYSQNLIEHEPDCLLPKLEAATEG